MRRSIFLMVVAVVVIGLAWEAWAIFHPTSLPAQPATSVAAASLLTAPIADSTPNADIVGRGQYLARTGDCLSCHLAPGGQPFAGGLGMNTPFGVIYTSNITPDQATGIGAWTADDFYGALHDGVARGGAHLYPAFPYPWFQRVSRADSDALYAYLRTVPAVRAIPPANTLPFPLNIRAAVMGWNLLFFKHSAFTPEPGQSAEWNRGAEIVTGLGHCSGCHSPTNQLGGVIAARDLQGGTLDNYVAPDLTANPRTGLGAWSVDEIAEYLKSGRNDRANAGAAMADVVTYSTSLLTDADRHAVAVYLKSLPASPDLQPAAPDAGAMQRGAAIYSDVCSACHLANGVGQPTVFPPLGHNSVVQQDDATGVARMILAGDRTGPAPGRPSPLTMPSFAWKLSDAEVADVATYLRNSWGNRASAVSPDAVTLLRNRLGLDRPHLTANSGDHE
jgi:mono/diheme cytochrome c family protein